MHKPHFFISSSITSSHDFFGLPLFICPETFSSLTLLTKFFHPFFQGIQAILVCLLSLVSPRWFSISSTPVLHLSKPFRIPSRSVFSHIILILLSSAACICLVSSFRFIAYHTSYTRFLKRPFSFSVKTFLQNIWDISLNFCQPAHILAITELWTSPLLPTTLHK